MLSLNGQKRSVWIADFETTTDPTDCRVWAWALCDVFEPSHIEIDKDIDSFCRYLADTNRVVFFHNLAFDGAFILDFLLRHGFRHVFDRPRKGEFMSLISDSGKFYSITVRWKNGRWTEFRDSLKKLPMGVAAIAKSFKLKDSKGSIDYDLPRPIGWEITPEERDYITKDVRIVAEAIRMQIDEGMTKLTVGADSLAQYKSIVTTPMFNRLFPVLPPSMDAEIRKAYRGGFTYADERFRGKRVGRGRVYDVNSLYPSVMYDRVLPWGEPVWCDSQPKPTETYPLWIASITFISKLKYGHIPCIQVKSSMHFIPTEYQKIIEEPITLSCTNVDFDLWCEHYDIEVLSWNGGWQFRGIQGVFKEFIDKWMEIKATTTGGMRTIAKLHLNSLYGKFATNPNVTGKVPVLKDDVVQLVTGPEETRNPVYTAMGVFITAYARDVTIRAAQAHYDRFLYADTDSLHLLDPELPNVPRRPCLVHGTRCYQASTLDVHPTRLGAWKEEYSFSAAIFARAKAYTELTTDPHECDDDECTMTLGYQTHIAGLPDTVAHRVTFADYVDGHTFSGKLLPKRVPGGIVLTDVDYTLHL